MGQKQDDIRYENGKQAVRSLIANATSGTDDPQQARAQARESLETYREQKGAEMEEAAKKFSLFQRIEFVIGALVLIQIAIFMLRGEPYIVALIFTTTGCMLLYLVVAILDSRAKGRRQDIHYEMLAARKVKLKNGERGVIVEFE
ncbi:MAG: hypothetical protein LBH64_04675 [Coriobacteriales bacterium]|jgi:hypothetical protein|nr:hypothetical protein [Coriobacteriales bacterium]